MGACVLLLPEAHHVTVLFFAFFCKLRLSMHYQIVCLHNTLRCNVLVDVLPWQNGALLCLALPCVQLPGLKGKRPFFKMKSCIGELVQRVALPGPCCIHSRLAWPAAAVGRSRNVKMHARRPQKVPVGQC